MPEQPPTCWPTRLNWQDVQLEGANPRTYTERVTPSVLDIVCRELLAFDALQIRNLPIDSLVGCRQGRRNLGCRVLASFMVDGSHEVVCAYRSKCDVH